jgi:hypothetical protein
VTPRDQRGVAPLTSSARSSKPHPSVTAGAVEMPRTLNGTLNSTVFRSVENAKSAMAAA